MNERKPILHARDHLPYGADPIPGLFGGGTAPPPDQPPADSGSQDTALGRQGHWWRFREAAWTTPSNNTTPDVLGGASYAMEFGINGAGTIELVGLQPGPNGDSISGLHEHDPSFNAFNYFNGTAGIGYEWGAGGHWTVIGVFRPSHAGEYDIFNVGSLAHPTYLMLNPDGSVTVSRDGSSYTSAAGLVAVGAWSYIAFSVDHGRLKVFVNPGAPEPVPYDPTIGGSFPFALPIAFETWGIELENYSADELAAKLTGAGFASVALQLNTAPGSGRTHSDVIARLADAADVLRAAGLQIIGWGEVDGTTAADLAAIGADGWCPQVEGDSQRLAVISALGSGVGSGLLKAVVTNYGGLDTTGHVADLAAAGITAAAAEVYAADGHSNVDVILAAGQSYGFPLAELIPVLGTYRGELPGDYIGFDEDVIPHYGIYNIPQTSESMWAALADLNGGTLELSRPVIDVPDPSANLATGTLCVGSSNFNASFDHGSHGADGALEGNWTEVQAFEHGLAAADHRSAYLGFRYGDTGAVPPGEAIPPGGITPPQVAPGDDGQVLATSSGTTAWVDPTLDFLDDVDTSGVADGDVLTYDSGTSSWGPAAPTGGSLALDDLTDVATAGETAGDVLTFDGSSWGPAAPAGGGSPTGAAGGALDGSYPNPGLAASVAGSGLSESSDVLSVNVDGSTLEISADALRVKADGITANEIAAGAVGSSELASTAVGAGSYGDATHVGQFTVDADGRLTAAASVAITASVAALDDIGDVNAPSPANNDALTWDSGTSKWVAEAIAAGISSGADVQVYTSGTPTWTKPAGAKAVRVICIGAGGSGGSGANGNSTARAGGSGGGGGAVSTADFQASDLGSTVAVTVGTPGSSKAGTATSIGTDGDNGGSSSFGAHVVAGGGGGGKAGGTSSQSGGGGGAQNASGSGTLGGTGNGGATAPTGDAIGGQGPSGSSVGRRAEWGGGSGGGSGNSAAGTGGGPAIQGGPGGGGGGGCNASNTGFAGAGGGDNGYGALGGGGAGGGIGSNGTGGSATPKPYCGTGGGGGGGTTSGVGKDGGAGGIGAGGGGGGAGTGSGNAGGASGAGGAGRVIVITWV